MATRKNYSKIVQATIANLDTVFAVNVGYFAQSHRNCARSHDEFSHDGGRGTAVTNNTQITIDQNNVLLLAYRQPGTIQVDVVAGMVDEMKLYHGQESFCLSSLHNEYIVGGNSGGGLFIDGELVGNMWITLVVQEVVRTTGTAVGPEQQTNLSIAAQFPS